MGRAELLIAELIGNQGSLETLIDVGTAGLTEVDYPATSGGIIQKFLVNCLMDQTQSNRLMVSIDGGTVWFTLVPGNYWEWEPKNEITQLKLKGSVEGVGYQVVINRMAG